MSSESGKYLAEAIKTAASKGDLNAVSELADLFSLVCETSTKSEPFSPKELPALNPAKNLPAPPIPVPPIPSASLVNKNLNPVPVSRVRRLTNTSNSYRDVFWWLDFIYNDFVYYMKTVRKSKFFTSGDIYQYIRTTQGDSMTQNDLEMQPSGRNRWRNMVSNALAKAALEKTVIKKESDAAGCKRWVILEKQQPKGSADK